MSASYDTLNKYKIMWLYVFFDLPTNTANQRKAASRFRKDLVQDGFTMLQFSVYIRHCASLESSEVHVSRIKQFIPEEGLVSILRVTDKQFGDTINFVGKKTEPSPDAPLQLELF